VGVSRLGRKPDSVGLWRRNGRGALVLVVFVVVVATETVEGSCEKARDREAGIFIVLVDSLQG
jgi:hypothetical protein